MRQPTVRDYAPYFYDGKLHLPPMTIQLLIGAGLSPSVGEAGLQGLSLDEDRKLISEISDMLEILLGQLAEDDLAFRVLIMKETHFMFEAWPSEETNVA